MSATDASSVAIRTLFNRRFHFNANCNKRASRIRQHILWSKSDKANHLSGVLFGRTFNMWHNKRRVKLITCVSTDRRALAFKHSLLDGVILLFIWNLLWSKIKCCKALQSCNILSHCIINCSVFWCLIFRIHGSMTQTGLPGSYFILSPVHETTHPFSATPCFFLVSFDSLVLKQQPVYSSWSSTSAAQQLQCCCMIMIRSVSTLPSCHNTKSV